MPAGAAAGDQQTVCILPSHLVRVLADVQQHAGGQQHSEQTRSAVADERQRNSFRRHQSEHDAQIDQRLAHHHRRDSQRQKPAEFVRRFHRGDKSAPAIHGEKRQHDRPRR